MWKTKPKPNAASIHRKAGAVGGGVPGCSSELASRLEELLIRCCIKGAVMMTNGRDNWMRFVAGSCGLIDPERKKEGRNNVRVMGEHK